MYIHAEPRKKSEVVQELGDKMKQNEVREAMKNTTNSWNEEIKRKYNDR